MAKLLGPLKFSGSIGGLTFTKGDDGQVYVKEKSGPGERRMKKGDEFKNTRRNNAEWKTAARATKTFRLAMNNLMNGVVDRHLTGRITAWLLEGIRSDKVNHWGERRLEMGDPAILEGFEFNRKLSLDDLLPVNVGSSTTLTKSSVLIVMPGFRMRRGNKKIPVKATHFRVVSAMLTIDFRLNTYSRDIKTCEMTAIGRKSGQDFVTEHAIQPKPGQWCFWLMGMEFYQQQGDELILVRGGVMRCMRVIKGNGEIAFPK